jgi:hypothetical protein
VFPKASVVVRFGEDAYFHALSLTSIEPKQVNFGRFKSEVTYFRYQIGGLRAIPPLETIGRTKVDKPCHEMIHGSAVIF